MNISARSAVAFLQRNGRNALPWGNPKARQLSVAVVKPGCRLQTVFVKAAKIKRLTEFHLKRWLQSFSLGDS